MHLRDFFQYEYPWCNFGGCCSRDFASLTDNCKEEIGKGLAVELEWQRVKIESVDNAEQIKELLEKKDL